MHQQTLMKGKLRAVGFNEMFDAASVNITQFDVASYFIH